MSPRLALGCLLALTLLVAPDAQAEMGCPEHLNIDQPSVTLDPGDVNANEMSTILFCTDDTPNTITEITTVTQDPEFPSLGWSVSFDPHEVSVLPGLRPGQTRLDVHIASHFNSVGNPASDSVDVTITYVVFAPGDSGIENFNHSGSTVPGETGTYSFDLVNDGPLDPYENAFGLLVLDPSARIEAAPAGCDPPTAGSVACSADHLSPGVVHHVWFTVRNGTEAGDAYANFSAPWASEPDDEDGGHPNSVLLRIALGGSPASPPGAGTMPPETGNGQQAPARSKALTVTLPKHPAAAALKRGLGIKVIALEPGRVGLTLKVGTLAIAHGAARVKAGRTTTVKLKATRSAAKQLGLYAGKRARLTVAQGRTKLTRWVTLG